MVLAEMGAFDVLAATDQALTQEPASNKQRFNGQLRNPCVCRASTCRHDHFVMKLAVEIVKIADNMSQNGQVECIRLHDGLNSGWPDRYR